MLESLHLSIDQKLNRAQNAIFMAAIQPIRPIHEELDDCFENSLPKIERLTAAIRVVDTIVPGFAEILNLSLNKNRHLPFPIGSTVAFLDEGGDSQVYRLHKQNIALKLQRVFKTTSLAELKATIQRIASEHAFTASLYAAIPEIVPAEFYLIMQNPFILEPCAGVIQPYYADPRDFFTCFNFNELKSLLERDCVFNHQVMSFIQATLNHYEQTETSIDLGNGKNNLAVVFEEAKPRLKILDCHKKHTPMLLAQYPEVKETYLSHLSYLRFIAQEVESSNI